MKLTPKTLSTLGRILYLDRLYRDAGIEPTVNLRMRLHRGGEPTPEETAKIIKRLRAIVREIQGVIREAKNQEAKP